MLGEHTEDVLRELGYEDEIEKLTAVGVISIRKCPGAALQSDLLFIEEVPVRLGRCLVGYPDVRNCAFQFDRKEEPANEDRGKLQRMPGDDGLRVGFPPRVTRSDIQNFVALICDVERALVEASNARTMMLVARCYPARGAYYAIEAEDPVRIWFRFQCRNGLRKLWSTQDAVPL